MSKITQTKKSHCNTPCGGKKSEPFVIEKMLYRIHLLRVNFLSRSKKRK